MKTILILSFSIFAVSAQVFCQKQLVLLRKDRVLLRLHPGDEFAYKLKSGSKVNKSYVNNLSDTAIVIHQDTIQFYEIDRVYFRTTTWGNELGAKMVVAGVMLFLGDQLNYAVLQGNDPSIDRGVSIASLSAAVMGLPLLLIKRSYRTLNHRHRLLVVKKGSAFYREKENGFTSPYIEE